MLLIASAGAAEEKSSISENQLQLARQSFEAGNFVAALTALDRFEGANKPTVDSLDLRGCVYMEQQNFGEAAKAFEMAHVADPGIFAPRIHIGDLLFRQKKFAEARDAYETLQKETNILVSNERLRFGILAAHLAEHNDGAARTALDQIIFPTQTPAYYYAQAAWAFSQRNNSEAQKWIKTAERVYPMAVNSWFARLLYELGWIKKKPPPALYRAT